MAEDNKSKPKKGPSPVERLKKFVEDFVDGLQELLDPPRPVRVPVTAGGRRRY
jgi:hypothetical protein